MTREFLVLLFAFVGLLNAVILHWQYLRYKKTHQPIFCLLGHSCGDVIESKYGTTLGIKNEVLGIGYYGAFIALTILGLLAFHTESLRLLLSIAATVFSFYLLFIQSLILKKLCSWCLLAIGINVAILIIMQSV